MVGRPPSLTSMDDNSVPNGPKSSSSTSTSAMKKHDIVTEETPLLRTSSPPREGSILDIPVCWHTWSPNAIVLMLSVTLLGFMIGDQSLAVPQTRVFESIYCYAYWEAVDPIRLLLPRSSLGPGAIGGVEERWCKVAQVQGKVAQSNGTQQFLDCVPSSLLAIPFGWAADRYGRKAVFMMGSAGIPAKNMWIQSVCWFWQTFDIRLTWSSSLSGSMGGGSTVVTAMFFVVISDVTPEATRATTFSRIGAVNLFAFFVAPPISALLMTWTPWIPMILGTSIQISSTLLALTVPETLNYRHPTLPFTPPPFPPSEPSDDQAPPPSNSFSRTLTRVRTSTSFLYTDWRITALTSTFSCHMSQTTAGNLLLQYCSARYLLPFSRATLVLSIKSGTTVIFMLLGLPALARLCTDRFGMDAQHKDLYLGRASAVFMLAGWVSIALAPSSPFFTAALSVSVGGSGLPSSVRSYMTGSVEPHHVARMYTIVGIVDTSGMMAGGPLLAEMFDVGMQIGGVGMGLPFFFIGGSFGIMTCVLGCIGHRKGDSVEVEDQQEEGEDV